MNSLERRLTLFNRIRRPLGGLILVNIVCLLGVLFHDLWGQVASSRMAKVPSTHPVAVVAIPPVERAAGSAHDAPPARSDSVARHDAESLLAADSGSVSGAFASSPDSTELCEDPAPVAASDGQKSRLDTIEAFAALLARGSSCYLDLRVFLSKSAARTAASDWVGQPMNVAHKLLSSGRSALKTLASDDERTANAEQRADSVEAPSVVLTNPVETNGVVHFLVNGRMFSLPPGEDLRLPAASALDVRFDRGDGFGSTRRVLSQGDYVFRVCVTGWELDSR